MRINISLSDEMKPASKVRLAKIGENTNNVLKAVVREITWRREKK